MSPKAKPLKAAFDPGQNERQIDALLTAVRLPSSAETATTRRLNDNRADDSHAHLGGEGEAISSPSQHSVSQKKVATRSRSSSTSQRPPVASIAIEVYEHLVAQSASEKRAQGGRRRSYGKIVLDAIDRHREKLSKAWKEDPEVSEDSGSLFKQPRKDIVPARRLYARPPRPVNLAGVDPSNLEILDRCVEEWGTGTRSALVEQALRYEFDLNS